MYGTKEAEDAHMKLHVVKACQERREMEERHTLVQKKVSIFFLYIIADILSFVSGFFLAHLANTHI